MDTPVHDSPKWWSRWGRQHESPESQSDAQVAQWKAAWLKGANAVWAHDQSGANPYPPGMEHTAWDAGCDWATKNPDRRRNGSERMAHRHRRATDSALQASVKGAVGLGAAGLTIYAISKAFRRWGRHSRIES